MFKIFKKIVPSFVFWLIFIFVIFTIPYPEALIQANNLQVFAFFIPLFLAITFTFNLFLKNIFLSCSISLGLISLLILKALDTLNLVTGILSIVTVLLLISYFRKTRRIGLTKSTKIPKLTGLGKDI